MKMELDNNLKKIRTYKNNICTFYHNIRQKELRRYYKVQTWLEAKEDRQLPKLYLQQAGKLAYNQNEYCSFHHPVVGDASHEANAYLIE